MKLSEYLLLCLKDNPMKIPSVKFWAMTILFVQTGLQIQLSNYHILTVEDCLKEMDDLLNGVVYEGGWVREWWEQYQYLRGGEKKRWM